MRIPFPVVVKPNVGGSGAGIVRFDTRAELEAAAPSLALGPDGTALLQEFLEACDNAINANPALRTATVTIAAAAH